MQTNQIDPKLLDKLQKLNNLREGAEAVGSIAEAENAAMRIQELLLKHNLSMDDVSGHKIQEKATMMQEEFDLDPHQAKTEAEWLHKLFNAIARAYLCRCIHLKTRRHAYDQGKVAILGENNNVAVVFYTVEQLMNKIAIAEKLSWKSYTGIEKRNTFKRGFLVGAVNGISAKLLENQREMEKQNNSMALMVIKRKEEVDNFTAEKFPMLRSKIPPSLISQDGRTKGYAVGYNMNINKGMGGSGSKGHLS